MVQENLSLYNFPANFDLLSIIYPSKLELIKENNEIKGFTLFVESNIKPLKSLNVFNKMKTMHELQQLSEKIIVPISYLFEKEKIKALNSKENLENIKNINDLINSFLGNMFSIFTGGIFNLKTFEFFGVDDINISKISFLINSKKINTDINYIFGSKKFYETPVPYMSNFSINACFDKNALINIEKVKETELHLQTQEMLRNLNQKDKTFQESDFRKQVLNIIEAVYLQGVFSSRLAYLITLIIGLQNFDLYAREAKRQLGYDIFNFEMSNEFLVKTKKYSIYFIISTKVDKKTLKNPISIEAKIGNEIFVLSKNGTFDIDAFLTLVKYVYNDYDISLINVLSDKISFCKNLVLKDILFKKKGGKPIVKTIEYNPFNRFYLSLDGYLINMEGQIDSVLTIEGILGSVQEFFVQFFESVDDQIEKHKSK